MNTESADKTQVADNTVLPSRESQEVCVCPSCKTANPLDALKKRDYRCGKCKLELAHLDYAPNGAIRGVLGWLLAPGEVVLDRYKVDSVLGKGGFGAAYLVDDLQLSGKRRALKEVPEVLFDEYETALLSRLDHPAIPDIIERRPLNGMVYLVLKFGGSRTLDSERKQYADRRIPPEKLYPWMRQLCEVLIYLHEQKPPIIHRDLKPGNILLSEDDRIMLIDFGIAKEAQAEGRTRTLAMAATVGFSPPEQVMGTGTDERADIYALGATFYALLTGQNPVAAHERISGAELIPPSEIVPDVAPEIEDAIVQSLSLNKHHRQQTVREFAMALEGYETASIISRPIHTEAQEQATMAVSKPTSGGPKSKLAPSSKPTGLRLPTGRITGAPVSTAIPAPTGQRNPVLILGGIALTLAALSTAAYLYFKPTPVSPNNQQAPAASVAPSTPPAVVPAVTPVQPTPPPSIPTATLQAQPPSVQPLINAPPTQPASPPIVPVTSQPLATPPGTPAAGGGSAAAMLQGRVAEPESEPVAAPVAPAPEPKPRPKPRPHPVTRAPVERAHPRSSSGGSEPSWTIIPGGSRRTD